METDKTTLKHIAANLARYRKEQGLSFSELARRCTVRTPEEENIAYPTTIKRIEDADNMPSAALVKRLEEAMGLKPGDLTASPSGKSRRFKQDMANAPANVHRAKKRERPMPKQSA